MKNTVILFLSVCFVFLISLLFSCRSDIAEIDYGKDKCEFCKKMIIDERYSAVVYTSGGKTIKFDDLFCLLSYSKNYKSKNDECFTAIYDHPLEPLVNCNDAFFLKNEIFPSPSNGNFAAFNNLEKAKEIGDSLQTPVLRWQQINE